MTALPCPPQHWSRFSTLLDHAMDLPVPKREAWLNKLRGDDETLRPWLAACWAAGQASARGISSPVLGWVPKPPTISRPARPLALIALFRPLEKGAWGGCGGPYAPMTGRCARWR